MYENCNKLSFILTLSPLHNPDYATKSRYVIMCHMIMTGLGGSNVSSSSS